MDSVLAIFNRLYSDIIDLDPLVLPAHVPEIPPVKQDLNKCDNEFLKGQSLLSSDSGMLQA